MPLAACRRIVESPVYLWRYYQQSMFKDQVIKSTSKKNNTANQLSDDELLELIQRQTFKYFWEFAHPACGLARERNHEDYKDVVTTGGSGFGLMTMIVATEKKWITTPQFVERLNVVLDFLFHCEKYHGAFSHWYNGNTGETISFGKKDDGADLVETSFLIMGLLTVRQYLKKFDKEQHRLLIDKISALWLNVEWDWFTRGKNILYWHWRPAKSQLNLKIEGYNEALITYVLAATSPTHGIKKIVYDEGWARNGQMKNGKSFYETVLPLGPDYGGPLFFAQFSFLGLDPGNLKDAYADYWQQNTAHTEINYAHCVNNPKKYKGYGKDCWGLSACDSGKRYKPFHPQKDNGTICPSAAIASLPYLPGESMTAIRHFYFDLGKKIWGGYGFYDSFNKTRSWYAKSYLAINQAPIIIMIENYTTGLLWDLFMSCDEVKSGLNKLGFC